MNLLIQQAVDLLRGGKLVAFPTETVYGLGADANNPKAIERIFKAKKRPHDHPLIVHIADINDLQNWAKDISPLAFKLAKVFWPGPLSIVLKKQPHVLDSLTAGQASICLRIPHHPIAQDLLKAFGSGIAAPSANQFTHVSPTTAQAVREELGDTVDLILDGGACEVGLESTIIDLSQNKPVILRPGMITTEMIFDVLQMPLEIRRQDMPKINVPGMHHLHYAPKTKTSIIQTNEMNEFLNQLQDQDKPIALVSHHPWNQIQGVSIINLPQDAAQYAHDLYHTLRSLDKEQYKQIVIEAVPLSIEWDAIRDRLFKASGER